MRLVLAALVLSSAALASASPARAGDKPTCERAIAPPLAPGLATQRRAVLHAALDAMAQQRPTSQRPAQTARRMAAASALQSHRRIARAHVATARAHVEAVRYDKALSALHAARREAVAAAAHIADVELLASIAYLRGLALLATAPSRGRAALRRAFALSARERGADQSPKIRPLIAEARQRARQREPAAVPAREGARTLRLIGCRQLLHVTVWSRGQREHAIVRRWRVGSRAPTATRASWPTTADPRRVAVALLAASSDATKRATPRAGGSTGRPGRGASPPPRREAAAAGRPRRWVPWVLGATAIGATISAAAMFGVAARRRARAESLAGRSPLQEYGDEARDLERSAKRLGIAGAAVSIGAGLAAAALVAFWLWPERETSSTARIGVGAGAVTFALRY